MKMESLVKLAVALLGSTSPACGGGGGGEAPVTAAAPPATAVVPAAPVVTEQPLVKIGRCWFCAPNTLYPARVTIDGEAASNADVGTDTIAVVRGVQTTTNRGTSSTTTYRYDSLQAHSAVVGRIEAIDPARGRLMILGQDVRGVGAWISAAPWPNGEYSPPVSLQLTQLAVGDRVRVFGDASDEGVILATGVHPAFAGSPDRVTGTISSIDLAARTLTIGSLSVDYSVASLDDFPDGRLATGDRIEVVGTATGTPPGLRATRIEYRDSPIALPAGARLDADGLAERPNSTRLGAAAGAAPLRLGGHVLRLAAACDDGSLPGHAAMAGISALVGDTGVLQPLATQARSCIPSAPGYRFEALVTGQVTPLDAASNSLGIAGLVVDVPPGIAWVNSAGKLRERGTVRGTGVTSIALISTPVRGAMVATHVSDGDTVVQPPAVARVEGWMKGEASSSIVGVLGRSIRLDAETRAGLRSCESSPGTLTPERPETFTAAAFGRIAVRWVVATVAPAASGEWRAVTIETYGDPYCD